VAALWALRELVPHFGLLDRTRLDLCSARSLYQSDLRPLRGFLERWAGPALVIHGQDDALVPLAAAEEHHRILPQSELSVLPGGHRLLPRGDERLARVLADFLRRADAGAALGRAEASPERLAASRRPFDPADSPPLSGLGLALFMLLAALSTLVSEDLTCVAVGALVGRGRVALWAAILACYLGILVGDVLLFLAGRWLGRPALRRAPLRWFLSAERVAHSSAWFRAKGPIVILASRFLPGARLPTYFAAGVLHTSFLEFTAWFALAVALWTPLVVWASARLSGELAQRVELLRERVGLALLVTVLLGLAGVKLCLALATYRGRRLLWSRWLRLVRWEFWPPWALYAPLIPYFAWLGWRHGNLLAFTAANPALPLGGFVGESKADILRALEGGAHGLAWTRLDARLPDEERWRQARRFVAERGLSYPVVLKPEVGQRGSGVVVARDEPALQAAVLAAREDVLVQQYAAGPEFGLSYARHPDEERGRVFSVTEKRLVSVVGDGQRTLERLILEDPRAVCMARFFLAEHAERLERVPAAGERVPLGELGTHCRGAVFLDGERVRTPALEAEVERVARAFPGFHLGRFDVRAESVEELAAGRFAILELNGVTSEPGHVYHPGAPLSAGWRALAGQWRMAYEIGAANLRAGARAGSARELCAAVLEFRRRARSARSRPAAEERAEQAPGPARPGSA
jgi:membrane protein DedA with SNARE-associated domain